MAKAEPDSPVSERCRAGRPGSRVFRPFPGGVPVCPRPVRKQKSASEKKTGKIGIDISGICFHSLIPKGCDKPESVLHPRAKAAKTFLQNSPSPVPFMRCTLFLSHGKSYPEGRVGNLQKQQPHQIASQSITGAEGKVKLPPPLKARRAGIWKTQELYGQPCAASSPAIPENFAARRRT